LTNNREDPNGVDEEGETEAMPKKATRAKGWLAERLGPLGWSVHGFSEMLDEHYKQGLRWNSGEYDPPAPVMRWLEKVEGFFAENPPPKRADYAAPVPSVVSEQPSAFVQRIIDAMKPGETASTEEIRQRIGARRKAVEQRLAAASISGRLGPLRRVEGGVYRAVGDEVPPGGSLRFDPIVEPSATVFVGQILEVLKPGEEVDLAEVSLRTGFRVDVIARRLAKAAESGRLGLLEMVGEGRVRRAGGEAEAPVSVPAPAPAPLPTSAPPPVKPRPVAKPSPVAPPASAPAADYASVTAGELYKLIKAMGWSPYELDRALEWPGKDSREVRRWFQDQEKNPTPPEVVAWLRKLVRAKRDAEAAVPAGMPRPAADAMVSAALITLLGDGPKVREAALEARRLRRLARTEAAKAAADEPVDRQVVPDDKPIVAPDGGEISTETAEILLALGSDWTPIADLRISLTYLDQLRRRGLLERGSRPWGPLGAYEPLFRLSSVGHGLKAAILARGHGEQSIIERRKSEVAMRAADEDAAAERKPSVIPGVSRDTYEKALSAILLWIGMGETPDDAEAKADAEAALRATRERGMSGSAWITAAQAWLEREGYEVVEGDESAETPVEDILPPDYGGPSVRAGAV
jgi:hypothetical protein